MTIYDKIKTMIEEEVQGKIADYPINLTVFDGKLELQDIDYEVNFHTDHIEIVVQHNVMAKALSEARDTFEPRTGTVMFPRSRRARI